MSVSIRPHHTAIGVPQWRHNAARTVANYPLPDMTGLTLTADGVDYDIVLPDSVWLTIYEDLGEQFAGKAAKPLVSEATIAAVAAHSADYNARGGNDGIIPETPERGDKVMGWWPDGCGGNGPGGLLCTEHVNYHHVASGFGHVYGTWLMTADEREADFKRAMEAQS